MVIRIAFFLASAALLAACGKPSVENAAHKTESGAVAAESEGPALTVYSARNVPSDSEMYARFEKETGVHVSVRESGAAELLDALKSEGEDSPADLILAPDAGALYRFQVEGLTQPVQSETLVSAIPAQFREKNGHWFGLSRRARVIVYDPQMLPLEEVDTYADLAEDRLKGEVCVRSSSNINNLSLLGELIDRYGSEEAERWATGVAQNLARPPEGGDTAQIEAVAAGQCAAALVNDYYWVLLTQGSTEERLTAAKTAISFPDQEGEGTHVNITGAAVTAAAPNPDLALQFLEFLVSEEGQVLLTAETREFPVVAGVPLPAGADQLPDFTTSDYALSDLGANQAEAQAIFDRAGWN